MACVYTLRLPVRTKVSSNEVLAVLSNWINQNPCNDFRAISFTDLASPMELSAPPTHLSAARAVIDNTAYTIICLKSGAALSPSLPAVESMESQIEFFLEEIDESCHFTLKLHYNLLDERKSIALPPLALPEVFWDLARQGLLDTDGGLPLQPAPVVMTSQLDSALQKLRNGTAFSSRPLLFVREGNYALTPKLAARLSQFVHVLVLPAIHPALSGLGAGGARLFFARFKVSRGVDLAAPTSCEDIIEYAARLTALATPGQPIDYARLEQLSRQQTQLSADYLCMNHTMADAIRFYRIKNGLTQTQLAHKSGTTGLLISRLENNRPARVQESLIAAIEEALHLTNGEIRSCEGLSSTPATSVSRPIFCPVCGTKTMETGQFCYRCGNQLI